MKKLIAYRSGNRLFNILMFFIAFTFMLVWLPLLRCVFDGPSYSWGQHYFGLRLFSKGFTLDALALILFLFFFLFAFSAFYWIKNRMVFYILLILWWLHVFGNQFFIIIREGDIIFHGDTLNVHISILWIVIPLAILATVLIIMVIVRDKKENETAIAWSKVNTRRAILILSPILLQAILFATGEPHGTSDAIGVMITIIQSYIIPIIFIPKKI